MPPKTRSQHPASLGEGSSSRGTNIAGPQALISLINSCSSRPVAPPLAQFIPTPHHKLDNDLNGHWKDYNRSCRKAYAAVLSGKTTPWFSYRNYTFLQKKFTKSIYPDKCIEAVENIIDTQQNKLLSLEPSKYTSNINSKQRQALKELARDESIIIKSADKGSGITIVNTSQYHQEGMAHLSNVFYYEKIEKDYTKLLTSKINIFLRRAVKNRIISEIQYNMLRQNPDEVRTQLIYFLRKIHKDPHGLRPIVSGTNGPTETISAFLDNILSPYVLRCKYVAKSSTEIINLIESIVFPTNCILATMDVKSLYLTIPQEQGIEWVLTKIYTSPSPPKFPIEFLRQLLTYILSHNIFKFGDHSYRQCSGIAMGTRCAPNFANLYMSVLEESFFERREKYGKLLPTFYKRYIDDILFIWEYPLLQFEQFENDLDCYHEAIKFTSEIDDNKVNFLDITIHKGKRFQNSNVLDISPYAKPCHRFTYLHFTSCHPRHIFHGIIIGEAKRMLRNSSNFETYNEAIVKLVHNFLRRGYPLKFIKKHLKNIKFEHRLEVLHPSKITKYLTKPDSTTLKIPYHPGHKKNLIKNILIDDRLPFTPKIIEVPRRSIKKSLVSAKTSLDLNYSHLT